MSVVISNPCPEYNGGLREAWVNYYISLAYIDVITYLCSYPDAGSANLV